MKGSDQPGDQVYLGDLAVVGNFVCCLIVVTFMWLGRAYRLGKFQIHYVGGKPQRDGTNFFKDGRS